MFLRGDDKMRWRSTTVLAGISVGSVLALAGCVTPTNPDDPARNAAIRQCTDMAAKNVPGTGGSAMQQRTFIYKACMQRAGFAP